MGITGMSFFKLGPFLICIDNNSPERHYTEYTGYFTVLFIYFLVISV